MRYIIHSVCCFEELGTDGIPRNRGSTGPERTVRWLAIILHFGRLSHSGCFLKCFGIDLQLITATVVVCSSTKVFPYQRLIVSCARIWSYSLHGIRSNVCDTTQQSKEIIR